MAELETESVDAIVTDPPYGLSFMGKDWDHGVPGEAFWAEALRVAKPGAHLLAFGGTRTFHRLACAIEDAGWEIRDCLGWLYGSGFPKSADVSKMLDKQERKRWIDIGKAVDNLDKAAILEAWKNYSSNAKSAGLRFQKSTTEAGQVMPASDSAPAPVALSASPESSSAAAIIAELSSSEALRYAVASTPFVPAGVEATTEPLPVLARSAGDLCASQKAQPVTPTFTALCAVRGWQSASTTDNLKAVEALRTWLGSKPSSRRAATDALCAALTADLKHIILSQSATYQSADTTQQTAFASATTATITESTAASLISFMADTLSREAIDKAAGAERRTIGTKRGVGGENLNDIVRGAPVRTTEQEGAKGIGAYGTGAKQIQVDVPITAPATPLAQLWEGWGTALKPAWEPVILARKPLAGTVAANVLAHGTGALNIDGCRVGTETVRINTFDDGAKPFGNGAGHPYTGRASTGRWPANIVHDGSDEVLELFPESNGSGPARTLKRSAKPEQQGWGMNTLASDEVGLQDAGKGSASRFFYCAKASKKDRDEGLEGFSPNNNMRVNAPRENEEAKHATLRANHHPTVKPTALMRYLCRLITPPGGIILDPFCGSGSTGKAAVLEGFDFIGIDLSPEYIAIADARIAAVSRQEALALA